MVSNRAALPPKWSSEEKYKVDGLGSGEGSMRGLAGAEGWVLLGVGEYLLRRLGTDMAQEELRNKTWRLRGGIQREAPHTHLCPL